MLDPVGEVVDQVGGEIGAVGLREHLAIEAPRLTVVVVLAVELLRRAHDFARSIPGRLDIATRVGRRPAEAVRSVDRRAAVVLVAHRTVLVVGVDWALRAVDRQLQVVGADPVAVGVGVAEQAAQQHPVGTRPDARHHVRRLEGRLLDLGEEVLGIAVEHQTADRDRLVVRVRPDLRQVERVEAVVGRSLERHDLHFEAPDRLLAAGEGVVEVAPVKVDVLADHRRSLLTGEVLDTLLGLEVVLDPGALAALVDPHEGVAAVAVHVPKRPRRAAVGHQERNLVIGLRRERPEVPLRVVGAQTAVAHPLLRMDEIGELRGVPDEEHRRVVTDQVVVALLGVELQREAPRVADCVGRTEFTGNGREAREHVGLLADLVEECGARPLRDVLGHLEEAMGAVSARVHDALGHAFAIELRHLLDQVVVLQQQRAVRAGTEGVLVAGGWDTGVGGRVGRALVAHWIAPCGVSWQSGHRPQYVTSASSIENP